MGIGRFFNILLGIIAILVLVTFANAIQKTVKSYFEVQALADLAEARTAWSTGTVALSLERSVTQVALAIEDPIPAPFRAIINEQRELSDAYLDAKLTEVAQEFLYLTGGPGFLADAQQLRREIAALRQEVDTLLAVPLSARDGPRVAAIPDELKSRIARLQGLSNRLRIDSSAKSDDSISIEALQNLAWEIREYGGRARTYFAIATLTSQPLSDGGAMAIKLDSNRALSAWNSIQDMLSSTNLEETLHAIVMATGEDYFESYVPLTEQLLEASALSQGEETVSYPASFESFFERSSAALAGFEELVVTAGDYSTAYWNERRQQATWELAVKVIGLIMIVIGLFVIRMIINKRVTSGLESATAALTLVAAGNLEQSMEVGRSELTEILALNQSLIDLRNRLIEARENDQAREELQSHQQNAVNALSAGLASLAEGDLSYRIHEAFGGGYEGLRQDFNRSCDQLDGLIGEVVAKAQFISEQAHDLSAASQGLKGQTSAQAQTAMRTASSIETVAQSVQLTAQKAVETDTYVATAREGAQNGGEVVREAIGAMDEIKGSSDQISQTIGVIDDIAFQTNLLALNAGVEAARAGSAGRGFAVVASEVRALAQRASDAAKEIKDLITKSSMNVERGVQLVDKTGDALSDIVDRVSSISALISEISTASGEQSTSLSNVTQTVAELENSAKQTVNTSETSDQKCSHLNDQARGLSVLAGKFKTTDTQGQELGLSAA